MWKLTQNVKTTLRMAKDCTTQGPHCCSGSPACTKCLALGQAQGEYKRRVRQGDKARVPWLLSPAWQKQSVLLVASNRNSVQLQLKGMYWRNMVWLPDSTEKLEASERAGALGIQAAGINRHSPRNHSAKVICVESLC